MRCGMFSASTVPDEDRGREGGVSGAGGAG